MSLVNTKKMLEDAKKNKYAVGAFNVHNLETLKAVAKAAYEMRSPLILQTTPGTIKHAGEDYIAAMAKVASEKYDIPIALHLDHGNSFDLVVKCIRAGYTSVMIDGSELSYEQNVELTKKVVEVAHAAGVTVEAELGSIVGVEDDMYVKEDKSAFTDPKMAADFVEKTGVDSLAIAIGTAHGMYKGEVKLDFERLKEIASLVDIPLVLHGASGVPDELVKKAIALGICKLNIATELKIPFANAIKEVFKNNPDESDPRKFLAPGEKAIEEVVKEKIKLFGCGGKA
ncbi:fructose-1,6-bisphosphate aldolase, class II, various bacterial and amitochondriate protist [Thermoanaerobacter thermohydrosulfuricus WC1]|uniref:Fructose-1,6-bisphosphate aldolase, class II, various bacterial and amitochondriate protist n=1 Tax=Thermoanaerobacter thermohydrosulfuricus WC1 TaxID=1198630 RepID=M8DSE2_THETY|nr:class II fructose-1,6-bisphosphate aldolase [Thermoanaerobacter thermohydrosulfuricus]EMT39411.1 fructose-1,6-bisphosphate aldolase, class II, various bacterial and amitochondriate protist [Thermoanaerobacter thermohydrosulfuricus WC1]